MNQIPYPISHRLILISGVQFPAGSTDIFLPRRCSEWFWDSPSLICNGWPGALSWGVKLIPCHTGMENPQVVGKEKGKIFPVLD
jgi:hypothetical protein